MKKISLTIVFLAVLSSCMTLDKTPKNIDLVREMPELLGTWKWFETHVGGIVGVWNPTHFRGEEVTITFKEDNIFSISLNDSVVLSDVKYSVTKTPDSPYGDYCIGVSKQVQEYLRQNLGQIGLQCIQVQGYVTIVRDCKDMDKRVLAIIKKEGMDMGVEGGPDFHIRCHYLFME